MTVFRRSLALRARALRASQKRLPWAEQQGHHLLSILTRHLGIHHSPWTGPALFAGWVLMLSPGP